MGTVQQSMDAFVIKVMQEAQMSGLSIDASIWALGIAARSLASYNAELTGDPECTALAKQNLDDAFAFPQRFVIVGSDMARLREAYSEAMPVIVKSVAAIN